MAEAEQTGGAVKSDAEVLQSDRKATPEGAKQSPETLAERLYREDAVKDQATTEKKGSEAQTEGKNTETATAPEPYPLRLPEGTLVDKPLMDEFTAWAREHKFNDEQAQRAAELHLKAMGTYARETAEYKEAGQQYLDTVKNWGIELDRDPYFGGANKAATVADALRALNVFGPPDEVTRLRKDLQLYGWGDHPVLVRGLARVARLLGDKLPRSNETKTLAEKMYPNQE